MCARAKRPSSSAGPSQLMHAQLQGNAAAIGAHAEFDRAVFLLDLPPDRPALVTCATSYMLEMHVE